MPVRDIQEGAGSFEKSLERCYECDAQGTLLVA